MSKELKQKSFGEIWCSLTDEQVEYLRGYINKIEAKLKKAEEEKDSLINDRDYWVDLFCKLELNYDNLKKESKSKLKEAKKQNKELEENILNEMHRRFNLQYDDLDRLPIDDTQLGVEFVIQLLNQQDNE